MGVARGVVKCYALIPGHGSIMVCGCGKECGQFLLYSCRILTT